MKLVTESKVEYSSDKFIQSKDNTDYWWNQSIKAALITKNNILDLITWNNELKNLSINRVYLSRRHNVPRKVSEKENTEPWTPTCSRFKDCKFELINTIVGALDSITTSDLYLNDNLELIPWQNQ